MSPSKMRRTQAYSEGRAAFHTAEVRDPTPNPYAADTYGNRREAWSLGWEEEKAECAVRPPELTPVEAILASVRAVDVKAERERTGEGMMEIKRRLTKDAVASAIGAAESVDDLKAILDVLVEELVR